MEHHTSLHIHHPTHVHPILPFNIKWKKNTMIHYFAYMFCLNHTWDKYEIWNEQKHTTWSALCCKQYMSQHMRYKNWYETQSPPTTVPFCYYDLQHYSFSVELFCFCLREAVVGRRITLSDAIWCNSPVLAWRQHYKRKWDIGGTGHKDNWVTQTELISVAVVQIAL